MLHIIFGAPGSGKSSLEAYFLKQVYLTQGRLLYQKTIQRIQEINATREHKLTLPENPPIYSDFAFKLHVGYKKYFEPYYINGYYFGLQNDKMPTMYLPPYSNIFLGEAQRYYDSRQSATFPEFVSRAFEMHRHYRLDIYMDVQRVGLIDRNIRELCRHFIEVVEMRHELDDMGRIVQTVFKCREFGNWTGVNEYLNTGATTTFTETEYINHGNIFECFNSYTYFENYLPPDGKDFNYLSFIPTSEKKKLTGDLASFYNTSEPKEFRSGKNESTKNDRTNRGTQQQNI
jgi:hypothetical protein